jgi:FHS family glucose/mannose:H+ symporter-like MFS transporter
VEPQNEVIIQPFAFANMTAMFILIGAIASLYGPLLIRFSHKFQISLPAAGVVLSVHFVGALFGVPVGWLGVKRVSGKVAVGISLIVLGLGAAGVATANSWTLLLVSVFLVGFGFGALDFGLNTLLARTEIKKRPHRLSLANAGYALGAVVGPFLVIALHPHNYAILFGAMAIIAVLLSLNNRGLIAPPLRVEEHHHLEVMGREQRRAILWTFIVAYVLYVACESSASGWIASHLNRVGYTASIGSLITAGFWLGLAVGRVMGGPLHRRFSHKLLVLVGLALATVVGVSALSNGFAPYAYPILGVVLASVYPMGLIWYTLLCPNDGNGLALIILCMMSGGILGPGAQSVMVAHFGIHAVPVVIGAFALLTLGAFASALRFTLPVASVSSATANS